MRDHRFNTGPAKMARGLVLMGLLFLSCPANAQGLGFAGENADGEITGWFFGFEVHASLLSDVRDRSNVLPSFGYGLKAGHRWTDNGVFLKIEHNLWARTESGRGWAPGALNIGVGYDAIYAEGHVHTSVAAGSSILLFDTELDEAPKVGVFLELKPVGLRFKADEHVAIVFDPASVVLVAPVLGGIPLVHLQYRSSGDVEVLP